MGNESSAATNLKIILVDDHRLFREGLAAVLSLDGSVDVVASAGTSAETIAAVRVYQPDIVLLDIHMGTFSGLDLIKPIRRFSPRTKIVLLTGDESENFLREGARRGVEGHLLKNLPTEELIASLHRLAKHPRGAAPYRDAPVQADKRPVRKPTAREREILHWLAQGKSNPEIAIILGISGNTVKAHVKNLMKKLEVNSRVLLAVASTAYGEHPSRARPAGKPR